MLRYVYPVEVNRLSLSLYTWQLCIGFCLALPVVVPASPVRVVVLGLTCRSTQLSLFQNFSNRRYFLSRMGSDVLEDSPVVWPFCGHTRGTASPAEPPYAGAFAKGVRGPHNGAWQWRLWRKLIKGIVGFVDIFSYCFSVKRRMVLILRVERSFLPGK